MDTTNGAARGDLSYAGSVGIIPDSRGGLVCGFMKYLVQCTATRAELPAVLRVKAREWRVSRLEIHVDPKLTQVWLNKEISESNPNFYLISECKSMLT